jgi:hypothetical protein
MCEFFSATKPCSNCPYRTDAPLKLWDISEFEKLLQNEGQQFGGVYLCHKDNGSACVGWLIKQRDEGMPCISLRLKLIKERPPSGYIDSLSSPAPLYKTIREMVKANYPKLLKLYARK